MWLRGTLALLAAASALIGVPRVHADALEDGITGFQGGNFAVAHTAFETAAANGDSRAAPWLAADYYVGWGAAADSRLADYWADRATQQTSREESERAVLNWQKLADAGDPAAQVAMGRAYEKGIGVTVSPVEAFRWYTLGAGQGFARGQYSLAMMYVNGTGVRSDMKEFLRLANLAAAQGDNWSQYAVGMAYVDGLGVFRSFKTASTWMVRAAQGGNPMAMYTLGVMYARGDGLSRDYGEATRWYRQAAALGVPEGQGNLADNLHRGNGVTRDDFTAYQFAALAYDHGPTYEMYRSVLKNSLLQIRQELSDADRRAALFKLGQRCRDGDGVPPDAVQAYRYMSVAIDSEADASRKAAWTTERDALAAGMPAPQIERAQELARTSTVL